MRRFEAELATAHEQLERLPRDYHQETLDGLLGVLGKRDRGVRWHSCRAAAYAQILGKHLGLGNDERRVLDRGALLHDLGKMVISDQILLKPGSLDESEWDEMRSHPALGHGLLRDFEFLGEARTIVLQHHEHWNGAGYPSGLRGEAIHLGARITAVVDAFDAMTSPRPYRDALSFESAWREVKRCAGTQFDPALVEAFCDLGRDHWEAVVSSQRLEHAHALV